MKKFNITLYNNLIYHINYKYKISYHSFFHWAKLQSHNMGSIYYNPSIGLNFNDL